MRGGSLAAARGKMETLRSSAQSGPCNQSIGYFFSVAIEVSVCAAPNWLVFTRTQVNSVPHRGDLGGKVGVRQHSRVRKRGGFP